MRLLPVSAVAVSTMTWREGTDVITLLRKTLAGIDPRTEILRLYAAIAAVYAVVEAVRASRNGGGFDIPADVLVAAITAVSALFARSKVTPIADPRPTTASDSYPSGP
jgi:hypothetical protein